MPLINKEKKKKKQKGKKSFSLQNALQYINKVEKMKTMDAFTTVLILSYSSVRNSKRGADFCG